MIRGIFGGLALALGLFSISAAQADSARAAETRTGGPDGSVFGILSIPTGDYADDDDGLATLGFGVGAEYQLPRSPGQPVGVVLGGYFIHNPMDFDELEEFEISADGGGYNHFVALGGIRINDIGNIPGFYVQGMVGVDVATVGDLEFEYEGETVTQTVSPVSTLAFSIGMGRRLDRWDIGLRYLNFGEPELEFRVEDEFGNVERGEGKQKMAMLAVTVGYRF
jgi:hypothetical protein